MLVDKPGLNDDRSLVKYNIAAVRLLDTCPPAAHHLQPPETPLHANALTECQACQLHLLKASMLCNHCRL